MEVDFAFLADSAQESGGKLHALGIGIDRLMTAEVPVSRGALAVVVQVRYWGNEAGAKSLSIRVVDADGGNILDPIDGQMQLPEPPGTPVGTARLIIELNGVTFQQFGDHAIHVTLDGKDVARLPLSIVQATA